MGSISGSKRPPGEEHDNPLQYSCLENPHGQRSLAGYSPWAPKELDTTERLSTAQMYQLSFGCYLTNPSYPKFTLTVSS